MERGVMHQQDCQLKIAQRHKYFEFVTGKGPKNFVFDDGFGPRTYHSAGMVIESETFSCPVCGWKARIHNNTVRPD